MRQVSSSRRAPGVFSAFGMLFSDLRYDFVRTWFTRLDDAAFDEIETHLSASSKTQGRLAHRRDQREAPRRVDDQARGDMRYVGQEHAVTVDLPMEVFRAEGPRGDQDGISTTCTSCATAPARPPSGRRSSACARPWSPASCASRRRKRSTRGGAAPPRSRLHRQAPGLFRRRAASSPTPTLSRAALSSPATDRRAGADRGACFDHGADAGRHAQRRRLRQSRHRGRGKDAERHGREGCDRTAKARSRRSPRSSATASSR